MPRKCNRYSTGLPAEWIIPSKAAEDVATSTEQLGHAKAPEDRDRIAELPRDSTSNASDPLLLGPSTSQNRLRQQPRYLSTLPSGWTVSEPQSSASNMGTLRNPAQPSKGHTPLPQQSSQRCLTGAKAAVRPISTSLAGLPTMEYSEPSAPTEAFFPLRRQQKATRRSYVPTDAPRNSLPVRSKTDVSSNGGVGLIYNDRSDKSFISPATSKSDSLSYGRDLPAIGPSVSPSYSVV